LPLKRPAHVEPASLCIQVVPHKTERLTEPQARGRKDHPERMEAVARGRLEQSANLCLGENPWLPSGWPRHGHTIRGIPSDQAPEHRLAERLVQHLMSLFDASGRQAPIQEPTVGVLDGRRG